MLNHEWKKKAIIITGFVNVNPDSAGQAVKKQGIGTQVLGSINHMLKSLAHKCHRKQ